MAVDFEHLVGRFIKLRVLSSPVVVAGLGRCGTSLVFDSIRRAGLRRSMEGERLDALHNIQNGMVYKTHDYPPESFPAKAKLVFLFGNPMDIAVSAHRKINEWGAMHHRHCRSDCFLANDQILHEDSLQLSRMFDAWMRPHSFEFASLRYEALFQAEVHARLCEYLGFKLILPPYERRQADWRSHSHAETLEAVYGGLWERVQRAGDMQIWSANI